MKLFVFFFFIVMVGSAPCYAHKPSDSYLRLKVDEQAIHGEWAISLRDLELEVGLDADGDGRITWGEVKARQQAMQEVLTRDLSLKSGVLCPIIFHEMQIDTYSDGHYAVLHFQAQCVKPIDTLEISDHFLFDRDAQHKSLISVTSGDYSQSAILSTDLRHITLSVHAPSFMRQFREFTRQGALHIWFGFDHLVFIIAMLLPLAWVYQNGVRRSDAAFNVVFRQSVTMVTSFTLAHSITLALAMGDMVHVRSRIVESLIALTIMISCMHNIWPFLKQRLWAITFVFGLIHGLGFATTVSELGLNAQSRWIALLGFNTGVELGQLAIVAMLLPIFYTIREHPAYRIVVVRGGSWLIFVVASIWFVQRSTGWAFLSFLRY